MVSPHITWYHGQNKIEGGNRFQLSEIQLTSPSPISGSMPSLAAVDVEHSLEVDPLEIGDEGEWMCVVSTAGGQASSTSLLRLTGMSS